MGILSGVLGIAAIWIALKAKPLGNFPYRWGVYIGLTVVVGAITAIPSLLPALGALGTTFFVILGAIACLGILLRKRFGVVALGLMYLIPIAQPLLMATGHPIQHAGLGLIFVPFAIFAVVNAIYFKNRWGLLA